AAWRQPWVRMHSLPLPETTHIPIQVLSVVAEKCHLSGLVTLPQEILQLVRKYSASAHFWRYVSGLNLAKRLADLPEPDLNECYKISIKDVGNWERGMRKPLETKESLPVIRLTI